MHKEMLVSANYDDVVRTIIYTGRPMSVRKTPYIDEWCVAQLSYVVCHCHLMQSSGKPSEEVNSNN